MSNRSNIDDEMAFLSNLRVFINQEIKEKTNEIKLTNDYTQMALNYIKDKEVKELSKSFHTPFFAKITCTEKDVHLKEDLYIGRYGIYDQESFQPLVLDWRTPLANLYYENEFENISIQTANDMRLTFDVERKRQFVYEQGKIADFYDSTPQHVNHQLLLSKLEEKTNSKLTDIIETIQAEQNKIIRYTQNAVLVIQGTAGRKKIPLCFTDLPI